MEIDFSDLPYQKYHEYLRAPLKHFSGSDKIKCKDDDVCIPVINQFALDDLEKRISDRRLLYKEPNYAIYMQKAWASFAQWRINELLAKQTDCKMEHWSWETTGSAIQLEDESFEDRRWFEENWQVRPAPQDNFLRWTGVCKLHSDRENSKKEGMVGLIPECTTGDFQRFWSKANQRWSRLNVKAFQKLWNKHNP